MGRDPLGSEDVWGNVPSISATHWGPGSLLGSGAWSSTLRGHAEPKAPPTPTPQGLFWPHGS